ncbi:uncharacterized protein [Kogia breviceps]|uniref:uncharacterized protein n=1 Tax=Kogia breviceps TaxID=27615 RepID=UPI0034D35D9E
MGRMPSPVQTRPWTSIPALLLGSLLSSARTFSQKIYNLCLAEARTDSCRGYNLPRTHPPILSVNIYAEHLLSQHRHHARGFGFSVNCAHRPAHDGPSVLEATTECGSSGVLSLLFALNQEDGHHSIAVCKWDSESVLRNKQNYACFPNDEAPRLGRKPLRLCARTFSAPWGPRKWSSGPQVTMALPRPALHSSWSLGGSGAIESWCSPQVFMPCPCGQSWPSHPDATPPPLPRPPLAQSTPLFNSSRHSHPRFPLEPTDGSLSPASGA